MTGREATPGAGEAGAGDATAGQGEEFLPLPGGTWCVWRHMVLRGAGFPVRLVDKVADEALADAADRSSRTPAALKRYETEFAAASARAAAAVNEVARDPRFREAVAWQNRELLETSLDRHTGTARRDSRSRRRELLIASYLQRYTTKNDSIGYFGPIGWASWQQEGPPANVVPGGGLLGRRTVYFETWAMDAVAEALAARPELLHGIPPRRVPANHVEGDLVHLPVGPPVRLTAQDAAVLRLCDGARTVRDITRILAAATPSTAAGDVVERLRGLRERGLIRLDFGGPIEAFPERRLRRRLLHIPDLEARRAAVRDLDRLVAAKDALASAAGDADAVAKGFDALNGEFERLTGAKGTRLPGRTYAARTIAYEDTTRDIEVRFGPELLAELGGPLTLMLGSARWLAARVEEHYLGRLAEYYERRCRRTGDAQAPLASLLALATRDFYTESGTPPLVAAAVSELRRRWSRILTIPPGSRRHAVPGAAISQAVATEFASRQPHWAAGLFHSPDVMIAASTAESIDRGDYTFVLGELHTAFNTVESSAFVEQSPDRRRLPAMAEAVAGGRRIVPVETRAWAGVTARTSLHPAMLSPAYVYWAMGTDDVSALPVDAIPVTALQVTATGRGGDSGELIVQCRQTGRDYPLVEVIGEYLSRVTVGAFRMLPPERHTPRVTIDRLVVARETWRLPVRSCTWAFDLDERRRYRRMREWLTRYDMPRRAFYAVQVERKPTYVDFTSIPLVNVMARAIRRAGRDAPDDQVTVSEMLPEPSQAWLADAAGATYASELRLVAVERSASPRRQG